MMLQLCQNSSYFFLSNNNLDIQEGSDDIENIKALEDRGVVVSHLNQATGK